MFNLLSAFLLAIRAVMGAAACCNHLFNRGAAFPARLPFPAVNIQLELEHAHLSLRIYIGTDRAAAFFNGFLQRLNDLAV